MNLVGNSPCAGTRGQYLTLVGRAVLTVVVWLPARTSFWEIPMQHRNPRPSSNSENPVERKLAEALDNYTDPDHPNYDPDFAEEMRQSRPDWFEATKPS
jgi:hypothetical protein